ncbi:DUF192 domain-containing protein [Yoonia sp. R2331]|uniref:DUF192 domain-containing protein n=1 Tax=Yoonia sp. R2331 TaxID=3237238 RepID=UPI0034E5AAE4
MMRLALAFCLTGQVASAACSDDKVSVKGDFGLAHFSVDLADDPQERAQGLMFVEEMGTLEGMLFIYEAPRNATFWMRNTLIPLDMLFTDDTGVITHIHENAVPLDETTIDGGDDVLAVLEVNGGLSTRLGIKVGDVLQHPAFGANAVLPCE